MATNAKGFEAELSKLKETFDKGVQTSTFSHALEKSLTTFISNVSSYRPFKAKQQLIDEAGKLVKRGIVIRGAAKPRKHAKPPRELTNEVHYSIW